MLHVALTCLLLISVSREVLSQSPGPRLPKEPMELQRSTATAAQGQIVPGEDRQVLAEDVQANVTPRKKRSVFQLCKVIKKYTGNSCLDYNNYGCFCGLRSRGSNPVDQVDRCCREHDRCYKSLNCRVLTLTSYSMQCTDTSCLCTNFKKASCRYMSCQCDIKLAECLQAAHYDRSYKNYNTLRCH